MSFAKLNRRIRKLRIPQNKAIMRNPPAKLATNTPGGGMASFVILAKCYANHCSQKPYKSTNPSKGAAACHKVGKPAIHAAQVYPPIHLAAATPGNSRPRRPQAGQSMLPNSAKQSHSRLATSQAGSKHPWGGYGFVCHFRKVLYMSLLPNALQVDKSAKTGIPVSQSYETTYALGSGGTNQTSTRRPTNHAGGRPAESPPNACPAVRRSGLQVSVLPELMPRSIAARLAVATGIALGLGFMAEAQNYSTWRDYGGTADSAQYSSLSQINRSNVSKLRVAWTYPAGDDGKYFFNPLVAGGRMYVLARDNSIVALDAVTGREVWAHPADPGTTLITDRGINYWESKDSSDRRLLYASKHVLRAIDARTGRMIPTFGNSGGVDLRVGLDRDPATVRLVQSTTPGRVFEDLLILGSATNQGYGSAPGDIRAFDVRTGKLVWTFHTIPRPGEFGYETWPKDAWRRVGGANAWSELSLDEKRGILYAPTASAKYNFYGVDRTGANLFADCLLALDARTGKRLWHFQMVHHDIWDYDNATAPKLLTVQHDGKAVDVVAQVTKQGFVWVFNRVTGEPLWPVEERPVPHSDMPHEETWPTQPFPSLPPPFARQRFTVEDLSPFLSAEDRARFRDEVLSARNEGLYTPPSRRGTIQMPGNNGGANWGGAAVDPEHGKLFVVSKDLPALLRLRKEENTDAAQTAGSQDQEESSKSAPDRFYTGFGFMIASDGLSPIAPPWSSLTAYDLNKGTIQWKIPLGDVPELASKGFTGTGAHFPKVGPVVTAGGLLFVGTRDRKVRALDADNGKVLWEYELAAALEGMPAVYEIGGREYVVFCAAAQVGLTAARHEKIHGAYVAFTLSAP